MGSLEPGQVAPASGFQTTFLPPLYPEWLGDRSFTEDHDCRFAYVIGEMARGIATADMVIAGARAGLMAFFGSAGLRPDTISSALDRIQSALGPSQSWWGANLIHSPNEPATEDAVVDLFLRRKVPCVSVSAFMNLTPAVVRCAVSGLRRDGEGCVHRARRIFAKISRPEVAAHFLSPAPGEILQRLKVDGKITEEEAVLAREIPVAQDITIEADSGGHTDNRPLTVLLPAIQKQRDELTARFGYRRSIRLGAAGGVGTPAAVAAAFALGAAYVLTGSVNQAAVESGLSEMGRRMLAEADLADVAMAPASDMFERGVRVQVLKRGTLFAQRGQRLYEVYQKYASLEAIPESERLQLEAELFRAPLEAIWGGTRKHFLSVDPEEVARAERDPRHRMALVFRWYLFMGSQWARDGHPDRKLDYQIWCGPAMGGFNRWVRGSFLEAPESRGVVQIALNLLEGAAVLTRAHQLRSFGVPVPASAFEFRPRPLA